jgi:hypothetical protein
VLKTEPDFEQLVARVLAEPMRPEQRSALDARMAGVLRGTMVRRGLRRLNRPKLLLLVALLALTLPFAASGVDELFHAVTGPDFQREIDAELANVPLPAGRDWPDVGALQPATYRGPYEGEPPGEFDYWESGPGAARSVAEFVAVCVWFDEWLIAHDAGDTERQSAVSQGIAEIPTWPSWSSEWWDTSVTDLLQTSIDGIAAGDPEAVRSFSTLNCSGVAQP